MKILFLGDIVGEPGRKLVKRALPRLREKLALDLVVVNAENAAGGSGLDPRCYHQLAASGVDAVTMGDHIYKKKEILSLFQEGFPICKPANFPPEAPGPDHLIVSASDGTKVAVVSLLGRMFMRPVDCPFHAIDRVLESIGKKAKVILVDIHAEATSDKQCMLRHLVGRVSALMGTHTHVPTADAAVFPPGTGYITDVGMTGPYDSVIGRRFDRVLHATTTFEPKPFDVATGDPRISGALLDVDPATGRANAIELVHWDRAKLDVLLGEESSPTLEPPANP
ncbi:MAG: TIGR00282 family metallophosphoesterase [Planctomycetota bacterium]